MTEYPDDDGESEGAGEIDSTPGLPSLEWRCSYCGRQEPCEVGTEPGDTEPCPDCDDGECVAEET